MGQKDLKKARLSEAGPLDQRLSVGSKVGTHILLAPLWEPYPLPLQASPTPIPPGLTHQFKNASPLPGAQERLRALLLLANSATYGWICAADGAQRICPQMNFLVS